MKKKKKINFSIAIDGGSASGKTTGSKLIAKYFKKSCKKVWRIQTKGCIFVPSNNAYNIKTKYYDCNKLNQQRKMYLSKKQRRPSSKTLRIK